MINLFEIQKQYPLQLHNQLFYKYMLKEYFQYKMLDIIFSNKLGKKFSFIGGTSLRILYGIERFSEDLDFDCFKISRDDFIELTDDVVSGIQKEGISITTEDKDRDMQLNAFRRNIIFPGFLYDQKLSGHKEEKFLIKIESQPHFFDYVPDQPIIQKFNIFTQINATPIDVLLSMKIGAVLERQKGRDFYDCVFLMGKTLPNWNYLDQKFGINNPHELKKQLLDSSNKVDFNSKSLDFEKLIFNRNESKKVLLFRDYIKQKSFD